MERLRAVRCLIFVFCIGWLPGTAFALPQSQGKLSARDLFLSGSKAEQTTRSGQNSPLALRYSIIKQIDGQEVEVDSSSIFKSGERIRLKLEANDSGYLYVVQRGSSGKWNLLFPSKETPNESKTVEKGKSYEIPVGNVWFNFDQQVGVEKLFIVLSRQAEPDLERLLQSVREVKEPRSAQATYAVKQSTNEDQPQGGSVETVASIDDDTVGRIRTLGSRDLVVEAVTPQSSSSKRENAVYVANSTGAADSRVVADLTLNHQ